MKEVLKPTKIVVAEVHERMEKKLPEIIQTTPEDIVWLPSHRAVISHSYGCLIRNIVMNIFHFPITDIFVVGEKTTNQQPVSKSIFKKWLEKEKIYEDTSNTIDYLLKYTLGQSLFEWFQGAETIEENVRNSVSLLQNHPLIPKRILTHGILVDLEESKMDVILPSSCSFK
ncbi:carbonic anhydrase [Anoxybacillus vitaminiphilus]|uniref:carbonic anhydrase n=1 Tax=Paranoxybacillus vitaminiphilus TaxID=581036 RepID=A0A327YJ79_9BACL|nr:hypothetical protein [Anoxybacillus vitaminiphilus]RAK20541.1 carbonic anhydrase [Anoxybacillus vitaminiphilus]